MVFTTDIRIDTSDLKKLVQDLDGTISDLRVSTNAIAQNTAQVLKDRLQSNMPVATGAMAESVQVRARGRNSFVVSIGSGLTRPYHIFQESGYTPHLVASRAVHTPYPEVQKGGGAWVSRYTPYMNSSLTQTSAYLDRQLESRINLGRLQR